MVRRVSSRFIRITASTRIICVIAESTIRSTTNGVEGVNMENEADRTYQKLMDVGAGRSIIIVSERAFE